MKVNGQVLVVTGAGNGIGREVALELLRRGAKVAGLDLKHEFLEETKQLSADNSKNFVGFDVNITKAFLPGLIARPEAHILNVSSMGSFAPVPGQTLYGATKAAVNMLTEGLRSELKETNVSLTLVWPGAIGTNITANSGVSFGSGELTEGQKKAAARVTAPSVAGKMIVDAIETKANRIYVGSDSKLMGYLTRLAPDFAANLIYKNMKSLLG